MSTHFPVAGVDVGGRTKGFHAVAMRGDHILAQARLATPAEVLRWCLEHDVRTVGVDSPCAWSRSGGSRACERDLRLDGRLIQCFKTPTRERAEASRLKARTRGKSGDGFYGWVFHGLELYSALAPHYPLFDGSPPEGPVCFETFPQAIACALSGGYVSAKKKNPVRRQILRDWGIDDRQFPNIDFVDAALCAISATAFTQHCYSACGDSMEGHIVMPQRT